MNAKPVIVGGGPAGMAAAIELAEHGVHSTLLEEASRLGGVRCSVLSTRATSGIIIGVMYF